jgi:hypothetical protein
LLKKIMIGGLAVGALALNAPAALAAAPAAVGCRVNGVTQAVATGQDTWESAIEGYVVADAADANKTATIKCEIRVGTSVRGATSVGTGNSAAAVAEHVQYTRALTETPTLCAVWSVGSGGTSGTTCVPLTTQQIPPQEVLDALDGILTIINNLEITLIDPNLCPVLTLLNGDYGPVSIKAGTADANGNRGGDLYVNGVLEWDCPGYEPAP